MRAEVVMLIALCWLETAASQPPPGATPGGIEQEALRLLQRKVEEQETRTLTERPSTNGSAPRSVTHADIERLFLEGRITARQFQARVASSPLKLGPMPALATNDVHERALRLLRQSVPDPAANREGPALTVDQIPPAPESTLRRDLAPRDLTEIEAKVDQLLQKKEARDVQAKPLDRGAVLERLNRLGTHREKLDALLRLFIDGAIGEDLYRELREHVVKGG